MRVVVYPADRHGCGHHRLIWPAQALRRAGHDVEVVHTDDRDLKFVIENDRVTEVRMEHQPDVLVMQRTTHSYLRQAVPILRSQGVAVIIDVDDDLSSIHPDNPSWERLHPRNLGRRKGNGRVHLHSWQYLAEACRDATLVTVSTPALLSRYASHGRGHVLPNYLAEHYYEVTHHPEDDADAMVWPASLHSHPNDPQVVGSAVARLISEGHEFYTFSTPDQAAKAFGLQQDPHPKPERVALEDWPNAIVGFAVGIAPLADTRFNAAKSWLKPMELSAVGVPWVASPSPEYRKLHELGCGVLADKPKHWYRELRRLLDDPAHRAELSEAGRSVAETLRLENHAWRWAEAWDRAAQLQRQSGRALDHAT